MLRVNRYFLPGHVWHITHRCHKKEYLLKFSNSRIRTGVNRFNKAVAKYQVSSTELNCRHDFMAEWKLPAQLV